MNPLQVKAVDLTHKGRKRKTVVALMFSTIGSLMEFL